MTLDLTSYDAALKEHYDDTRVEDMTYRRNPFLALVPKKEDFGGKKWVCPIIYGNPQGRSKTFTNAQTRSTATESKIEAFEITRKKDYSLATIDGETIEASKGDANAFMEAATTEIDGAINSLTNSVAANLFGTSASYIGQVLEEPSTNASTFSVTMKNASDVVKVEVGMMLNIWSEVSAGTQRISETGDDEWVVAAVNRSTGAITLTGNYDANGTIAADDYIFIEGDRGNGFSGLEDWLPASAPSSAGYFGVDRSVDTTRLGGQRLDASAMPIEEALIEGESIVSREGGYLDYYFMNHSKMKQLKKSLGSKVQYVDVKATERISFQGIQVEGDNGPITVLADRNCPANRIFGICLKSWKLASLGKAVRVLNADGVDMLRQASADGYEVRYGFYGNLGCNAPGHNINIQV